jgi:FKBP-type peptidyl-prolyl cis-trans isomerase FklB
MNRFLRKSLVVTVMLYLISVGVACAQSEQTAEGTEGAEGATLGSLEERASYAIGMNMAQGMKSQNVPIDLDLLIQGMQDAYAGKETRLSVEQMQQALQEFQQMMVQRQQEARSAQGEKNKQEADAFFAENKEKEGVVTTDSGLQYMVMEEGDGPKPTPDDRVTVHYKGTLLDGTEFDSSYSRGQPATFPVNGVIKGWQEAIQLMPVGSKYKLWIPPDLAYGAQGQGPVIGPNQALVFEVELLKIEDKTDDSGAGSESQGGGR